MLTTPRDDYRYNISNTIPLFKNNNGANVCWLNVLLSLLVHLTAVSTKQMKRGAHLMNMHTRGLVKFVTAVASRKGSIVSYDLSIHYTIDKVEQKNKYKKDLLQNM